MFKKHVHNELYEFFSSSCLFYNIGFDLTFNCIPVTVILFHTRRTYAS